MSNLTSVREIALTLDITKAVQPANSFYIYRGDQVKFTFNFYNGENVVSLSDGTLRVFAKKIGKNGRLDLNTSPLFAKDQAFNSSDGSPTVSFQSIETAGEAGHYALCVMFFETSESEIKTTQLVYFDLIENGYAGSYQPAEDFRDEVLNALQQTLDAEARAEQFYNDSIENIQNEADHIILALNTSIEEETAKAKAEVESAGQSGITAVNSAKTAAVGEISTIKTEVETAGANAVSEVNAATEEAKTVIDGWTDQTSRLANTESAISLLQADKANRGYLQFNKGKLATATNNATTLPLTLCATYECADLSSGYFNFLATHKVSGWTTSSQTGSTSGFGFGVINNENYGNRIFGVKLSTPDAADIHVARHGYDCGVWLKSDSFDKFKGRHTFIATISEEITNGVPKIVLYFDGSVLSPNRNFKYNGGLQSAELGTGQGKISTGSTEYSSTSISTLPIKISRLKIFNCVLPATKADEVNGIGYTIEDYHNGVDEPPTMQDTSATYRALLSLQDCTITNGSTQQVFDVSGNANDATVVLSEGGSVKGSNDIGVSRLIDFIKGQSA